MPVVCFHNPSEENGYLSNWYPCRFTVEGVDFSSMEQYMMYKKAVYFGDKAVAAQILATDDVAEIMALGRLVANYSERYWNGIRQIVVFTGLLAKFTQNDDLKAQLAATKDSVLAECALYDRRWNNLCSDKGRSTKIRRRFTGNTADGKPSCRCRSRRNR